MRILRAAGADETLLRRTGVRLGLQAAAIVSVIVVLLTGTAVLVVLHSQHTAANALLGQALTHADDVGDPPSGVWLSQLRPDGTILTTAGAPALPAADDALRRTGESGVGDAFDLHLAGREYRVQTERRDDGSAFGAALDLLANHAERDRLISAMLGAGAICLLLAAAAGAWLGRRATRPLATALALQRRFVADASHELRTPLTLLSTRVQLLRRGLRASDDPEMAATVGRLLSDTRRLATLLDDLLLSADPAAARSGETVDLAVIAAEVVAEVEHTGTQHRVRVTGPDALRNPGKQADPCDPFATDRSGAAALPSTMVSGSPVALRRAVTALVDNAIRHANETVEVSVHRARGQVVLEVADDGRGVDLELASRLFDRFASSGHTDALGRRHYGLGLALVSDIAAGHDGTVELARDDPTGTVFRISMPAAGVSRGRIGYLWQTAPRTSR